MRWAFWRREANPLAMMHKAFLARGGKFQFAALLRHIFLNRIFLNRFGGFLRRSALAFVAVIFTVAVAQAQIFSDDEARAATLENTEKIAALGRVMNNLRTQLASMLQQQQVLEQDLRELSGKLEETAKTIDTARGLRKNVTDFGKQQSTLEQEVSSITVQVSIMAAQVSIMAERFLQDDELNVDGRLQGVDGQLQEVDGQLIALSIRLSSLGEQMSELVDIIEIPSENDMYGIAFSAHQRQDYQTAISGFKKLVRYYPDGVFSSNAHYWMTQGLLESGDYAGAEVAAEEIINNQAVSDKTPDALLALARAQRGLEKEEARAATLNRLIENYPTSLAADKARQMLFP